MITCNSLETVLDAALGEILTTASKMDWLVTHGERYLKPESRSTNWMLVYKSAKVYYEPLGVVAAIVSWNYRTSAVSLWILYLIQFTMLRSSPQFVLPNPRWYLRW